MEILESYFGIDSIKLAWKRYVRTERRGTKDQFGIGLIQDKLDDNLQRLSETLVERKFEACRPVKYYTPKPSGTQRTHTQLHVYDALAYQAIANTIASNNYTDLTEYSHHVFGSMLHPEVEHGVNILKLADARFFFFRHWQGLYQQFTESVNASIKDESTVFKLETDLTGFFDSVPHSKLLLTLQEEFDVEEQILDWLEDWLNIWSGTRSSLTPGVGIPTGPLASPFFANIYLHEVDRIVSEKGLAYYRYMDDIRIYSPDESELRETLVLIDLEMRSRGLSLNSKKTGITRIVDREEEQIKALRGLLEYGSAEEGDGAPQEWNGAAQRARAVSRGDRVSFLDQETETPWQLDSETVASKQEIVDFCRNELSEVEAQIETKFSSDGERVHYKGDLLDIADLGIELAYRFRNALRLLADVDEPLEPPVNFLPLWFFFAEKTFWKIEHFLWNIALYSRNPKAKRRLLELYKGFPEYEWVQSQVILSLAQSQEFSGSELRNLYKKGKDHPSFLVRLSFFKLLIMHLDPGDQLLCTVTQKIKEDDSPEVRRQLFFWAEKRKRGRLSAENVAEMLGML